MIVGIAVAGLLVLIGILVKYFRWYWLIAGYNTMPKEKKQNVDVEKLGDFLGNGFFIMAALFLAAIVFHHLGSFVGFVIMLALFLLSTGYLIVGAQKYDHNRQQGWERWVVIGVVALIGVIAAVAIGNIIYGAQPPRIEVNADFVRITGTYGTRIVFDNVEAVELRQSMPRVEAKLNGFDAGSVRKGYFRLEEIGRARLYVQSDQGPFIYVYTSDGLVIINYDTAARTEEVYEQLREQVIE